MEVSSSNVRHFEAFERNFKRKCEAFIKNTRLFEDISREMEDSV
jgi:hypothetical protein